MKFKKVLFSIFMMFLSTLVVYADVPESITINGSNLTMLSAATYLPNYNEEGLNVTIKETTDGKITYCINPNRDLYTGVMTYNKGNKITDSRVLGVLVNGYNYGMNTGNSGKDYFITNLALWTIVEPSSYKLQGVNCNANTYNGTSSTTVASACALATQTYTPPTSSISVNSSNVNMSLDGNYYVTSSAIGVNLSSNATNYTVTLGSGAPTGAVVTDSAGNTKTTFNKGESFKVKVPKSSVTSTTSFGVTITATYTNYAAYEYNPTAGNSYQSVALLVTENSTKSTNLTLNISVVSTVSIKVYKYIEGTSTLLSGADLTLLRSNGTTVDTWNTSNSNPHTISNLEDDDYMLREGSVPSGYEIDNINVIGFRVRNGVVTKQSGAATLSGTSVIVYNRPVQQEVNFTVKVIKANGDGTEVLSGASFELRNSQNQVVDYWISDTNAHITVPLSPGVYTLNEVQPPSGYIASGPTSFRLGTDGSVVNISNNYVYPSGIIIVFNDSIPEQVFSITLVKRDAAATSTLLSGAKFTLKNNTTNTTQTLSFGTNTSITVSNLTPGSYTLTETQAPTGYALLANAITFNISSAGTITNLSGNGASLVNTKKLAVDNSKVTTQITIVKRDAAATSTLLSGAKFTLKNNTTNTTQTLSFGTNTSVTVSNLTPGSYTLTETQAPTGYALLANAITFNISNTGTITNLSGTGASLINTKKLAIDNSKVTAKITIIKKDAATNGDLTGAKFKLQKTGETTFETLNFTSASVVKTLTPGSYTLTETQAPEGYELDTTPIKFTVSNTGVVTNDKGTRITGGKIVVYNEKEPVAGEVVISKRDVTTGEELPGATLELYDSSGSVVTSWVSTTTPKVISNLSPGTYRLKETIAPEGYELSSETISFTIGEDGKVVGGVVVMNNQPKPVFGKVVISKVDAATNKELPGAVLVIKNSVGEVIDRWTSTSTPRTVSLEPGVYTLTEITAPKKYILNKETITFSVNEDGTVSGKVVMKNYPDEVKENVQTGSTLLIIAIVAGLLSLGYAIFIFLKNNKNKSQV